LTDTIVQYDDILKKAREIVRKKSLDYGESWRELRLPSITDQIYVKAKRIRQIEDAGGKQEIPDTVENEYYDILNYCVFAIIKLEEKKNNSEKSSIDSIIPAFDRILGSIRDLMVKKNKDYGDAWRDMRIPSMTDQIIVKAYRIKQIEKRDGKVIVSEGIESEYKDIINYVIFSLILFS
jgi:hypothetical protein